MSLVVVIVTALMLFVVPIFKHLFTSLGSPLPLPTLIVIDISDIHGEHLAARGHRRHRHFRGPVQKWIKTPLGREKMGCV